MILDASAILAVVFREAGCEALIDKLLATPRKAVGAPTLAEAALVLTARLGPAAAGIIERFVQEFELVVLPFGEPHWRATAEAYFRFGKGRHPAALNFGDCLAYAVARLADRPLLFVGNDFSRTDLVAAP
jgi:ribonuclease VapC